MKRFYSMLLALGVTSATMLAQTVTVFMKDNTVHKYNAEYLSKIAVRDATPSPDVVDFKTIDLNVYSGGNVTVTLKNETGDVECVVDLYGSTDACFLQPGVYNVEGTRQPFTVDPAYSNVKLDGESSKPASGTVQVAIGQVANPSIFRESSDSHDYTINVDIELENGKSLTGRFVGELPTYTPWISAQLTQASYNVNPQPEGQYYLKFYDADWKYDIAMVFMADGSAASLPEGTYRYSDIASAGSLLASSYVDGYSPNFHCTLLSGSEVTVTKTGEDYHIEMTLALSDGRDANFTFDGSITGTPTFEVPDPIEMTPESLEMETFGNTNVTLYFYNEGNSSVLALDTYLPADSAYLPTGVYTVGGSETPYVDTNIRYTYYIETTEDAEKVGLKSGTLTVSREGEEYTFVLNAVLDDGKNTPITFNYTSALPKFGPVINSTLSAASYNSNPQPAGQFYVKFNDADWKYDIAMVFKADASATSLPEGTYSFSDTPSAGSLLASSYVDGYSPNFHCTLLSGSEVTVTKSGEDYHIEMILALSDGRDANFTFDGSITGTPSFEESDAIEMKPESLEMEVYSNTNVTLEFHNEGGSSVLALDTYLPADSSYLPTGVYTIGGSETPYIGTDIRYTYYIETTEDAEKVALKSGKLTIFREGEEYTFVLDAVLDDGKDTPITFNYTSTLPKFGPVVNVTLTGATYNSNPQPKGSFYVKFNDASYDCEMAIHFWMFPFTDRLYGAADGEIFEFVDSATGTPFTFTNDSYVELYRPYSRNNLVDGSKISVLESADQDGKIIYTMDMNLNLEDGRTAHITYEGPISGTPTFQ